MNFSKPIAQKPGIYYALDINDYNKRTQMYNDSLSLHMASKPAYDYMKNTIEPDYDTLNNLLKNNSKKALDSHTGLKNNGIIARPIDTISKSINYPYMAMASIPMKASLFKKPTTEIKYEPIVEKKEIIKEVEAPIAKYQGFTFNSSGNPGQKGGTPATEEQIKKYMEYQEWKKSLNKEKLSQ